MKKTHFKMILACLIGLIIFTTTFSNAFDEPGKPGTPEATDWDRDYIEIKWDAPINDGGSPILYYIIESREKGSSKWIAMTKIPGHMKIGKVPGNEGSEAELRVIAVNAAGPSEPSEPTRMLTFRPR